MNQFRTYAENNDIFGQKVILRRQFDIAGRDDLLVVTELYLGKVEHCVFT
jgi:hypothetical protein